MRVDTLNKHDHDVGTDHGAQPRDDEHHDDQEQLRSRFS